MCTYNHCVNKIFPIVYTHQFPFISFNKIYPMAHFQKWQKG